MVSGVRLPVLPQFDGAWFVVVGLAALTAVGVPWLAVAELPRAVGWEVQAVVEN